MFDSDLDGNERAFARKMHALAQARAHARAQARAHAKTNTRSLAQVETLIPMKTLRLEDLFLSFLLFFFSGDGVSCVIEVVHES